MDSSLLAKAGIDPAYLFIGLFVCVLILFFMAAGLNMKYQRLKSSYNKFMKGKEGKTLEESSAYRYQDSSETAEQTGKSEQDVKEISKQVKGAYQKTGIVRYNAFPDMGGNLSFALTLLDKTDSGFIFNALHTESGCYTYIKEVIRGQSYIELSKEESESLDRAIFQEAYGLDFREKKM